MIGANGAGKTTTLKTIVRLLPMAEGSITYDGKSTSKPLRRGPGRGSASRSCPRPRDLPNLTVKENLELGAFNHKRPRRDGRDDRGRREALSALGERMKQEAARCRGRAADAGHRPGADGAPEAILLLDEPSLGIAPKLVQADLRGHRAIAETGTTILLVEQNTRSPSSTRARVRAAHGRDRDEWYIEGSRSE
jgi:branched-chain amino acid transport system ATP-binding protein